jgi:nitrate/TMAO reductase-like tetraheme cytochrome c subunit
MLRQGRSQFGLTYMDVFKEFKYPKALRTAAFAKQGLLMVLFLVIFSGCTSQDVEKAFKGDLRPGQANKVIGEYCQSCHIHKDFDPPLHVSKVRNLYNRPAFKKARECRSCHYIEKNWMHNQHERKTRMPEDANRGSSRSLRKKI